MSDFPIELEQHDMDKSSQFTLDLDFEILHFGSIHMQSCDAVTYCTTDAFLSVVCDKDGLKSERHDRRIDSDAITRKFVPAGSVHAEDQHHWRMLLL